jgi:putative flippase GtrA
MWTWHPKAALFARYVTVGGVSAIVEFLIFSGLAGLAGLPIMFSNVVAVSVVTVAGFLGHKWFTYRDTTRRRSQVVLYLCQIGINFVLNNVLVYLFAEVMRIPPVVAKPLQLALCFVFTFSFSRLVVFRSNS